ncbi:hypothetical protein AAMO2058_001125600 [Amorphochlora amoebiformis]
MWRVTGDYRIIPGEHSLFFLGEHTKSLQCHGEFIGDYDLLRHRPLAKATKLPYLCLTFDYKTADVVTRSAPNHETIINDLEFDLNIKVFYKIIVMKLKSFKFDVAIQGLATPTMNLTPGLTCPCGVESDSKFFKSFSLKSGESENIEYPLGVSNLTFEFNRDIGWLTGFFKTSCIAGIR